MVGEVFFIEFAQFLGLTLYIQFLSHLKEIAAGKKREFLILLAIG